MSARSRQERARKRARRARKREEERGVSASPKGLSAWFPATRPVKRIFRPDGSVTRVHESCGFVMEMTFAGGGWVEERK